MPAHSPEEIHASMTAASNADDPRRVNRAAREARERTDAVSPRQHDGNCRVVLDNPMIPS